MSSTNTSRAAARGIMVLMATILAVAGALFVNTSSAHAVRAIDVDGSGSSSYLVTDLQTVTVLGSGFTPGKLIVIAECNATAGGLTGTHCSAIPGSWTRIHADGNGNFLEDITVHEAFSNFNFQTGQPLGTATTCWLAPGWTGRCQIQVAEYANWPAMGPPTAILTIELHF